MSFTCQWVYSFYLGLTKSTQTFNENQKNLDYVFRVQGESYYILSDKNSFNVDMKFVFGSSGSYHNRHNDVHRKHVRDETERLLFKMRWSWSCSTIQSSILLLRSDWLNLIETHSCGALWRNKSTSFFISLVCLACVIRQ